jgi:hypothetical protein
MGHKVKNLNLKVTPIKLVIQINEKYDIPLDNFQNFWFGASKGVKGVSGGILTS